MLTSYINFLPIPWRLAILHHAFCSRRSCADGHDFYGRPTTALWFNLPLHRRRVIAVLLNLAYAMHFGSFASHAVYQSYLEGQVRPLTTRHPALACRGPRPAHRLPASWPARHMRPPVGAMSRQYVPAETCRLSISICVRGCAHRIATLRHGPAASGRICLSSSPSPVRFWAASSKARPRRRSSRFAQSVGV